MALVTSEKRYRLFTCVSHCNTGVVNLHSVKMTEFRGAGPWNPFNLSRLSSTGRFYVSFA